MECKLTLQVKTKYNVKVFDKDGKLLKEVEKSGDLVLNNFLNLLSMLCGTYSDSSLVLVDESGTERARMLKYWHYYMGHVHGVNYIEIGTGTTTPTEDDYALASFLARSPELTAEVERVAVGQHRITLTHRFDFDTETTITEIGVSGYDGSYYYLMIRDLLDPSVTVPAGGFLMVGYQITITMTR